MGKTFKDRYHDDERDEKNYRVIKMKKIKGWRKPKKESELESEQAN